MKRRRRLRLPLKRSKNPNPLTLVLAAGSLTIIAMDACALPAARAAGVDPMQVLREG